MNDLINIENKILVIRDQQVMLDRDLAELYGVETGRLNEAVKRNIERFPDHFCFQLNQTEFGNWKSQFAISNSVKMGLRKKPYAFTEQGVAMLSAVLRSETAVKVSIEIMNAFVHMRHYLHRNTDLINRVNSIENKIDTKIIEYDENFSKIFKVIDFGPVPIKQGIFIQGQIFDAYTKFQELIQKAKTHIKKLDIAKFNAQYPTLTIKNTTTMHDRFLIIDKTEIYHIGASLKDLGKKCFGFTRLEEAQLMIKTVMGAI